MKTSNHEMIVVICNSGFADVAMGVARENGARGGTIVNARGVVNEEAAAFFGITLHEEKELLMIVVDKQIRDTILNALYTQMEKKSQTFAFAMPVSDVAGLLPAEPPKTEE